MQRNVGATVEARKVQNEYAPTPITRRRQVAQITVKSPLKTVEIALHMVQARPF